MTVTYATVNGQIICENRGGVETFFTSDTQGNLIQARDSNGTKVYEAWYWPYGEVRQEVYTKPKANPWGYIGLKGYLTDLQDMLYVRARYYRTTLARWQTVDPLWPIQAKYLYVYDRPLCLTDPRGLFPSIWGVALDCGLGLINTIYSIVSSLISGQGMPDDWPRTLCKAGAGCLGAVLGLLIVEALGGPENIGADCLGGAAGSALGYLLGLLCNMIPEPANLCRPSGPPVDPICQAGMNFANAAISCVFGMIGSGVGKDGLPIKAGTIASGIFNAIANLISAATGQTCYASTGK